MTEDEAKTKWCPFVRAPQVAAGSDPVGNTWLGACNKDQDGNFFTVRHTCIASDCMAWREITACHAFDRATGEDLGALPAILPSTQEYRSVPVGGYCGLAGEPR